MTYKQFIRQNMRESWVEVLRRHRLIGYVVNRIYNDISLTMRKHPKLARKNYLDRLNACYFFYAFTQTNEELELFEIISKEILEYEENNLLGISG